MSDPELPSAPAPEQKPRSKSLLRSSLLTGSMTMLSRVLGLVRDIVLASLLGAGGSMDAFAVAQKIPNFFRRLFAEGAFSQAFIPVLAEYREKGSRAAVKDLVDKVAGSLGLVLLLVTLVGVLGAAGVSMIFASGYLSDPAKFDLLTDLVRITFPYLMLISLTGFAGAILNSYDRFAVPAVTPVFLNIFMIAAALLVADYFPNPAYALAWSILVAGVFSLLFQLPFLRQIHLLPSPKLGWSDPGVKRILALMAPALFGVSISQINLMLDTIIATQLGDASASWLFYSDRLVELPLGVFGVAIATVIMPSLSRQSTAQSAEKFSQTLDWAIRFVVLIALPATLALVILAEPILFTLFYHGKMAASDILMSSYSLQAYALGLFAFMLIKVLVPGYFARQDMKTPVRTGIKAIVANILMKPVVVLPLAYFFSLGHVGLALTTALAAYVNAWLLYRGLRQQRIYQPASHWPRLWLRYGAANLAMVVVLLGFLMCWADWQYWHTLERIWRLAVVCVVGGVIYLAALLAVGIRLRDFKAHG
ncbi:murein biosynthesis integral membrane protein MurJ [Cellvibrio japonicus]|uniref:Probable lipid II flippase MurJ n=1 Tax=Cellvibrio japonicus (strain Ueda107) TaxID=498211 RepID=B3PE16_CELJU|nr:murein biosynthesis integral membrane protein MurJ [Cellvibrio japonicus]ACE85686.1 integral membrane protein MviN [Cellvibrio japonicus Ueda107]